jgi:hypothetical protein
MAFCVDDMPTAGHHTMAGAVEALQANGTLQRLVDALEGRRLQAFFGLERTQLFVQVSALFEALREFPNL